MCGRFTLTATGHELAEEFELPHEPTLAPRYNIAPTQPVAAVRVNPHTEARELDFFHWGLIPHWAKDPSFGARMINARGETVAEKPSFRAAFRYRRCLIPASGFYEWRKENGHKQPFYIYHRQGRVLALAGLWEHWQGADGSEIESCTIITTGANERVRELHHRMPVIVQPEDYSTWLAGNGRYRDDLQHLLRPAPETLLDAHPISTYVNRPANEGPECVAALAE